MDSSVILLLFGTMVEFWIWEDCTESGGEGVDRDWERGGCWYGGRVMEGWREDWALEGRGRGAEDVELEEET